MGPVWERLLILVVSASQDGWVRGAIKIQVNQKCTALMNVNNSQALDAQSPRFQRHSNPRAM